LAAIAGLTGWSCRAAPGQTSTSRDISAADMRARISFLASDSLRGRATPSRGLEMAADYVAAEFGRFELEAPPGGYVQRYRLARTRIGESWSLSLSRAGSRVSLHYEQDFWGLPWAAGTVEGQLRFVGAAPPAEAAESAGPEIWVAELTPGVSLQDWLREAEAAGAGGIIFVFDGEVGPYLPALRSAGETVYDVGEEEPPLPAVLAARDALGTALKRLGLESWPAAASPSATASQVSARLTADLGEQTMTAPNVVAIARGSDPRLRNEYVLVTAHMDHLGVGTPVNGDSIYNGADDNASGTAGVLEVAEAVAALAKGPRRSIMFATMSGEERGLLGSSWFVEHPPVPLNRVVADVNVDMIGRNWEDTISVIGKPYSTLGTLVDSVAAAHPELGLAVAGDLWPAEGFFFRSDHFNFARKGIPAIFFFNGVHEDYHQPSDEVEKIEFEKAARVAGLVYQVAVAVANGERRPEWDPRIRDRIVGGR
jgi:hypothetical protein